MLAWLTATTTRTYLGLEQRPVDPPALGPAEEQELLCLLHDLGALLGSLRGHLLRETYSVGLLEFSP